MALTNTYTTGATFPAADANAIATAVNTKNQVGTFSGRPAAGNLDAIYYCKDNDTIYHDTGSAWEKISISGESSSAMGDVPTSGWTAVNMQSGASWASDKDAMLFTVPTIGSGNNWQYQYRTYPTPPFTLTTYIDAVMTQQANPGASSSAFFGIVVSDGTKLITHGPGFVNTAGAPWMVAGWDAATIKWTNATTYNASYNTYNFSVGFIGALPKWYRYIDDNTNITWQYSLNGIDWVTVGAEARTTFLTPSRIGVGASNFTGNSALARFRSWNGVS